MKSKRMKKAGLLWVDLEMTGLDPEKDRILEIAVIATNWDLEKIAEYTAVVKVPKRLIRKRMVGEFWEKNKEAYDGLVRQNTVGKKVKVVEKELLELIEMQFGEEVYLAGNSIHQDRKFIDREWPKVGQRLHYRMLDVSAWKVFFEHAKGKKFRKRETHRALDDIQGSIEELRYYASMLKEGK